MKKVILFVLMALCSTMMLAQTITVKGTVIGAEDGMPIIGAYVLQQGTNNGTSTDVDGNYVISVPSDATLVFSSVGFTLIRWQLTAVHSWTLCLKLMLLCWMT